MLSRALETHKNKRTLVDHLASKNKKQKTSASRSTIRLPDTLKEETTTQDGCSPVTFEKKTFFFCSSPKIKNHHIIQKQIFCSSV